MICRKCKIELNETNWYAALIKKRDYICKNCQCEYKRQYRKNNQFKKLIKNEETKIELHLCSDCKEIKPMYVSRINAFSYFCIDCFAKRNKQLHKKKYKKFNNLMEE
jgi:hypothetical protein